jgi:Cu-Zn family superoxide dismutase
LSLALSSFIIKRPTRYFNNGGLSVNQSILFNALIAASLTLGAQSVFAAEGAASPTPVLEHPTDSITVNMMNAKGESVGTATITQKDKKGLSIALDLHGLPAGTHGFHIHNKGSCVGPDFKSAGDHYSPEHHKHGHVKGGPHAGDMANLEVGADGILKTTVEDDHASLGASLKSLQKGAGTALVIHEKADDYKTQPSGDSGARIACGEIKPLAK